MWIDDDACYQAVLARDGRFDGRFFVAVASTGIYCRPICRVRTPKRSNCSFYPSAAAAEAQGYRPCLRCRPELAPGHAAMDAAGRLAHAAAGLIEDGREQSLEALARRLGVTDRHLRRVFTAEFGVAPVAYAQTQRLLLAKRLLTDTRLPITQVALSTGFASVRRFNDLFRRRYRLQPRQLRKMPSTSGNGDGQLVFELAYRPPYDWRRQLAFLAARCVQGVEVVEQDCYLRTVAIESASGSHRGWIRVAHRPRRHTLAVTLCDSLSGAVPQVLARVRHQFDLSCRPEDIARHLGALAATAPGLRVPGAFDGFEVAVRAVLGQQITVSAARTLACRLADSLGESITTPHASLRRTFPSPVLLARADAAHLGRLGVTRARQRALGGLADACASGELLLSPAADVESTLHKLLSLPGIGPWTAQCIAMRALGWPDAFPHTDYGVLKALAPATAAQALKQAETWRPWRAYATVHLWNSLHPETSA